MNSLAVLASCLFAIASAIKFNTDGGDNSPGCQAFGKLRDIWFSGGDISVLAADEIELYWDSRLSPATKALNTDVPQMATPKDFQEQGQLIGMAFEAASVEMSCQGNGNRALTYDKAVWRERAGNRGFVSLTLTNFFEINDEGKFTKVHRYLFREEPADSDLKDDSPACQAHGKLADLWMAGGDVSVLAADEIEMFWDSRLSPATKAINMDVPQMMTAKDFQANAQLIGKVFELASMEFNCQGNGNRALTYDKVVWRETAGNSGFMSITMSNLFEINDEGKFNKVHRYLFHSEPADFATLRKAMKDL